MEEWKRVTSAVFYGITSLAITFATKFVLTTFGFPSFQVLTLGQTLTSILCLWTLNCLGAVQLVSLHSDTFWRIWPLPIVYLGNAVAGLGGIKYLNLPMFTVLRRFTIPMTMLAERYILGVRAPVVVKLCVLAMVFGALVAAFDDVVFSLSGYVLVLSNDVFTALNAVLLKKKLDNLGKLDLIYCNCLFVIGPAAVLAWSTGDVDEAFAYKGWKDTWFLVSFSLSCVLGFVLNYSIALCTQFNGALTTSIIGCLKNIVVTYFGMMIGGDYVFTWINFLGLNISSVASVFYTYAVFVKPISVPVQKSPPDSKIIVV